MKFIGEFKNEHGEEFSLYKHYGNYMLSSIGEGFGLKRLRIKIYDVLLSEEEEDKIFKLIKKDLRSKYGIQKK